MLAKCQEGCAGGCCEVNTTPYAPAPAASLCVCCRCLGMMCTIIKLQATTLQAVILTGTSAGNKCLEACRALWLWKQVAAGSCGVARASELPGLDELARLVDRIDCALPAVEQLSAAELGTGWLSTVGDPAVTVVHRYAAPGGSSVLTLWLLLQMSTGCCREVAITTSSRNAGAPPSA